MSKYFTDMCLNGIKCYVFLFFVAEKVAGKGFGFVQNITGWVKKKKIKNHLVKKMYTSHGALTPCVDGQYFTR